MNSSKLVNNVYPGGEETFRQLFQQYGESIYQMLAARCQDRELAREILRKIFQDVYEELIGVGTVDVTAAWLKSCAETHLVKKQLLSADVQLPRLYGEQRPQQQKAAEQKTQPAVIPPMPPLPPILEKITNEQLQQLEPQRTDTRQQFAPQQMSQQMHQSVPEARQAQRAQPRYECAPQPYSQAAGPAMAQPFNYEPYAPPEKPAKRKAKNGGRIAIIAVLSLMIVITLWMLVGLLMDVTLFPAVDLGYTWFNTHVIDLF